MLHLKVRVWSCNPPHYLFSRIWGLLHIRYARSKASLIPWHSLSKGGNRMPRNRPRHCPQEMSGWHRRPFQPIVLHWGSKMVPYHRQTLGLQEPWCLQSTRTKHFHHKRILNHGNTIVNAMRVAFLCSEPWSFTCRSWWKYCGAWSTHHDVHKNKYTLNFRAMALGEGKTDFPRFEISWELGFGLPP